MAKKSIKGSKDSDENNMVNSNASSGETDQQAAGKNVSPQKKGGDGDLDKLNKINQSRRSYYSRNGHGGYRGL
jgi:hypothetical protein